MDTLIIILFSISIILFIVSLFRPDKTKTLENDIEQLSMQFLQENYLLKKRVKVLEEELLLDETVATRKKVEEPNEILKNHCIALYRQGLDLKQISKQSTLPLPTIRTIINQYKNSEKR